MTTGLRERWRVKARRTIQECALDLFDERGFGAVTIEEVAAAAEVSPSSVYRYFGTKEGLIVADEFDTLTAEALQELFDPADPVGTMTRIVRDYEAGPADAGPSEGDSIPRRRIRYFFSEPSIRTAFCASLDRASQRIAPLMTGGQLTDTQARVAANALVFGYFSALEQWYLDGGTRPVAEYVEEGLDVLRPIWSTGAVRESTGAVAESAGAVPESAGAVPESAAGGGEA